MFKDLFYLLRFFLKLQSKSVIYYGGHFHRTKIDGVYFNRFFDALSYNYGLSDNHYTFEFLKIYNRNFYQSSILDLTSSINAYNTLNPSLIANYTYDLVKQFNSFYQSYSIVGKQPVNSFRLALSKKVGDQIKLSMSLLGIDCPERM